MMPDRMETIKGLELVRDICQAKAFISVGEGRTAWNGYAGIQDNAIILLQGREPVEPHVEHDSDDDSWYYGCGKCHEAIDYKDKFCRHCGCEVAWDV